MKSAIFNVTQECPLVFIIIIHTLLLGFFIQCYGFLRIQWGKKIFDIKWNDIQVEFHFHFPNCLSYTVLRGSLEPISVNWGHKVGDILEGMPIHRRARTAEVGFESAGIINQHHSCSAKSSLKNYYTVTKTRNDWKTRYKQLN